MPFIQDIIVNITRGTKGLVELSFRPLIVGTDTVGIGVVVASELADLITAGYVDTDDEYKMASAMFAQSPRPVDVAVLRKADAVGWDTALTTLLGTFQEFYSVCINSRTIADLNTVGTWASGNARMFFGQVNDVTAGSGRNLDREAYLIHDDDTEFAECAWVGQNIPAVPGSNTWKWKRPVGVSAPAYTLTELNTIRTNNTQAFQEQAGSIYTNEGITTAGEFIDLIIGQDWVKNQLEVNLLNLFLKNAKVAMDNPGISQVENEVRGVLKRAGNNGIIAQAVEEAELEKSDDKAYMYQVTVPKRSELSANDLANRVLKGVEFVYYSAGAIHRVEVTGLITV